jgi:signal transduction histidine kinase
MNRKSSGEQAVWVIYDERGAIVGRSADQADGFPPPDAWSELPRLPLDATSLTVWDDWRVATRTLRLKELLNPQSPRDLPGAPEDDVQHDELLLVAAVSPLPARAALRLLLTALGGGSIAIWIVCALFGRRLVCWAMSPVRTLAAAAARLAPGDPGWQLPRPGTADELDEMAAAFNQLLGRLHEAFESQRRFTGEASHQLRTPLAGMLGQLDVALRRDRSPEEYRRVLLAVREESRRLARIVESLLLLSRTEASAPRAAPARLELTRWLLDGARRWTQHPRQHDLRWRVDPNRPIWVRADSVLLGQAVDNLIDNALKYSAAGAPVDVSLAGSPDEARLTVEDRGTGIAADDLTQVFQPFFRSGAARLAGRPGYGLGLPVARRIVEAYAGSLDVESSSGQGSRFTLRLPLSKENLMLDVSPESLVSR